MFHINEFSAGNHIQHPNWEKAELISTYTSWGNFTADEVVIKKDGYVYCSLYADSTAVYVTLNRNGTTFNIAGLKSNIRYGGFTDVTMNLTPVKKGDIVRMQGGGGFTITGSTAGMCGNGGNIYFIPFM